MFGGLKMGLNKNKIEEEQYVKIKLNTRLAYD
jgi:hypothetical protein